MEKVQDLQRPIQRVIQNSNEEQKKNEQTIDIKMQENGEAK